MSASVFSPEVQLTTAPVLLGGENRSGTTLLSIILDSHPDLSVGPEIDFTEPVNLGPHILKACDFMDDEQINGGDALIRVWKQTENPAFSGWYDGVHFVAQCERSGLSRNEVRAKIAEAMQQRGNDLSGLMDRCFLMELMGEYQRTKLGTRRWGLKLQRKIRDVDRYAQIWPNAHFIHIVRDGRDLAASHLKTVPDWGYRSVSEAAHGWLEIVSRSHKVQPPHRYLEIRYEDLVTDTREVLKTMLAFLGLPWSEAPLRHSEQNHTLLANPWGHPAAEDVSKPLYTQRNGRYKTDLSPEQTEEFERIAGSELLRLGYGLSDKINPGS
ncbi:sulfotransferase [Pantoea vagans]|uniref:sulfotransferase family protein n=1 Tax=Pantoea vagans TaxID=470934 RepID=UPI00301739C5